MPKRRNASIASRNGRTFRTATIRHRRKADRVFAITLFGRPESFESVVRVVTRAIQNPRVTKRPSSNGDVGSTRPGSATRVGEESNPASAQEGRWPLDLVGGASGMLVLRVWPDTGLETYGLCDADLIVIRVGDPSKAPKAADDIQDGEAVFVVIKDQVIVGQYQERSHGRIEIIPFVEKSSPVVAPGANVKVVFGLMAVVHMRSSRC